LYLRDFLLYKLINHEERKEGDNISCQEQKPLRNPALLDSTHHGDFSGTWSGISGMNESVNMGYFASLAL